MCSIKDQLFKIHYHSICEIKRIFLQTFDTYKLLLNAGLLNRVISMHKVHIQHVNLSLQMYLSVLNNYKDCVSFVEFQSLQSYCDLLLVIEKNVYNKYYRYVLQIDRVLISEDTIMDKIVNLQKILQM